MDKHDGNAIPQTLQERLQQLGQQFAERLRQELPQLMQQGEQLLEADDEQRRHLLQALRNQLHRLAGSAGTFGFSQLYVSLGDPMADGGIVVRIWWKPWILCIWYGTIVMMAGGIVSLSDRRLRVGAPKRAKVAAKPALEAAE